VTIPAEAGSDLALRDGTRVHIRPIRPEDDHALVEAFHHMSPQTIYQRFFAALPELSADMAWRFSHVNYTNRMALVAETADSDPPQLMAVGRYERTRCESTRSAPTHPETTRRGWADPGSTHSEPSHPDPGYAPNQGSDSAELGLVVLDQWQGLGLGRILLRQILAVAARNGITRFTADILADNRRMLHLLATEARVVQSKSSGGVTTLLLSSLP
jgi:GNAT superfamily N-acetyltransferase